MRTTQKTIARAAGVTPAAVCKAMKNHPSIPIKTRERILKIAADLNYKPNTFAQALVEHRTAEAETTLASLAFIFGHKDTNPLFEDQPSYIRVHRAMKKRAKEIGFSLSDFWYYHPNHTRKRLEQILAARGIQGVVLLSLNASEITIDLEPYSVIHIDFPGTLKSPYNNIGYCSYHLVRQAYQNLFELGFHRIGLCLSLRHPLAIEGKAFAAADKLPQEHKIPCIPPLSLPRVDNPSLKKVKTWAHKYKPEAILTLGTGLSKMAKQDPNLFRQPTPRIFDLDYTSHETIEGGIDRRYDHLGKIAIDTLSLQIRQGETGKPQAKYRIQCPTEWRMKTP